MRTGPYFKTNKSQYRKIMKKDGIKVRWIKAHWDFAYSEGNIGYVTPKSAEMLLAGGFIIPLPDEDEDEVNPLPEDLPARTVLFAAGFKSLDDIKAAGDSLLDAGISVTTLKKVKKYLAEK